MAEVDSLEIGLQANAKKANDSIETLITKLGRLASVLGSVNGSQLGTLAMNVNNLGASMKSINDVGTASFTRLAKNITKIASVDSAALNSVAGSLNSTAAAFGQFTAVSENATKIGEVAKNISKLGNKSVQTAVTNIPQLATALQGLFTTLASTPTVSNNVIQMTNALANLASQGSRVGAASRTIQRSMHTVDTSAQRAQRKVWSLAATFGRLYANYFFIIRGTKHFVAAIKSATDYIEAFNYYAVAFGKIGSEWGKDFEKYGYDNATDYANSFSDRVSTLLGKLSGLQVDVEGGLLTADSAKNLGLNIQEVTEFASQLASVTNSLGQTGETTTAVAKSMTMLAGDISSLFNIDYTSVATNIQSGLIGQSRALYKYGIDITNATLQTYAYNLGVEKSISEMTQMEKQQLRVLAILDQSKVSWGDLSNTLSSPSNQIRQFNTNIKETGMVLGQIFIPVIQKVMPVVNGVTIAIKRMLVSFATLMGVKIDFDAFGQNGYQDTTDGLDDMADGYDSVAEAAKNAQKGVRGFDELNNISTGKNKSGSSTGTGDTIDLTDEIVKATEEYEKVWNDAFDKMENKAEAWADKITKALSPVKSIFKNFVAGDFFAAGQDTSSLVSGLFNWVADAIDNVPWFTIGRNVGKYLAGLDWTEILKSAAKVLWEGFKGALEFYAGMFTAAPLETVVVSFMAMPGLLKAITASKFVGGVGKLWKKFVLLGNGAEAAVMALSGNQAAASALTFMFPGLVEKITAVKLAFTNFSTSVKNNGFWNAVGNGVTAVRNNLTGFQKGLIGVASTAIEFTVLKDAFNDLTVGSDNMLLSIGKIAGVSAAAAGAMYLAFGPAGIAIAGITGVVAAISGIKKGLDEVEQSSMISALSIEGGATLEEFNQKATSTFDNVKEKAEETTQKISEIDTVKSNIADTVESIGTIYTAVESGAKNVEDEIPRFKSAFEQLKTDTESVLKQEYDVIVGYILGAVSDTTEALGGETPKAVANALGELYGVQEGMLNSLADTREEYDRLMTALDNGEISMNEFIEKATPLAEKLSLTGTEAETAVDKIASYGKALDLSQYISDNKFDVESFTTDINAVAQSAQDGVDAVKTANENFNKTFDEWKANAEKQGQEISEKSQNIIDSYIGKDLDKNLQQINDAYTEYANAVQYGLLEQLPSVIEKATEGYENLNWFSKAFTTETGYVNKVIGKWQNDVLNPTSKAIQEGFNQLGIEATPFAGEAAKKIYGELFDEKYIGFGEVPVYVLKSNYESIISDATANLPNYVNTKMQNVGESSVTGYVGGVNSNSQQLIKPVAGLANLSLSTFMEAQGSQGNKPSSGFSGIGKNSILGYMEGIKSLKLTVTDKMSSLGRITSTAFADKVTAGMPSIGIQVMNGFMNGLSSMETTLYSKVDEIAANVATTMQKALGIHSPSRVMFELGAYTTEGFKDGMESLYKPTELSIKDFGFGMVEAVHPQQLYSGYADYTPSVNTSTSTTTQNYYNTSSSVDNAETNALLREQNELLQRILAKEYGISKSDIGKASREYARDFFKRTGRDAYTF